MSAALAPAKKKKPIDVPATLTGVVVTSDRTTGVVTVSGTQEARRPCQNNRIVRAYMDSDNYTDTGVPQPPFGATPKNHPATDSAPTGTDGKFSATIQATPDNIYFRMSSVTAYSADFPKRKRTLKNGQTKRYLCRSSSGTFPIP